MTGCCIPSVTLLLLLQACDDWKVLGVCVCPQDQYMYVADHVEPLVQL